MFKQTIHAAATQQLKITPKLCQAIHLLQLSTPELVQELQQLILGNICLESEETTSISESDLTQGELSASEVVIEKPVIDEVSLYASSEKNHESLSLDHYCASSSGLHEHLCWQLNCALLNQELYSIGMVIIDSINGNGFLEASDDDLILALNKQGVKSGYEKIEQVIKLIQQFEPSGVGARNLSEALMIQLNQLSSSTRGLELAKKLVSEQLSLLAAHKYDQLCRLYQISRHELEESIHLIQSLQPRPGSQFSAEDFSAVIPDVLVEKKNHQWVVFLNSHVTPKLHLNNYYTHLAGGFALDDSKKFINQHLREARWLVKCIHNRNETLLKVSAAIVEYQQAFLDFGAGAIKPLVLKKIADDLNLHPSTISRITTRKYIQTPRGTFELKYFFTSHVMTEYGEEYSAVAIQKYIQEIINKENKTSPLSDENIAKQLLNFGINVARRTIAKYRDVLAIPPARLRRSI